MDRREFRRHLLNVACEFREQVNDCLTRNDCGIDSVFAQDFAGAIVSRGDAPQLKSAGVGFRPLLNQLYEARGPADANDDQTGRQRVKGAAVADSDLPTISGLSEDVADTGDGLPGCHPFGFVDRQESAERLHRQ